ncbi:MAG: hypothetical protein ACLRQF_05270 [Thomasclavelia ramosa]
MFAVLAKQHYRYFDDIIAVRQESITTTRRSNIATYTEFMMKLESFLEV